MNIKVNEAGWDRISRIVVGVLLFVIGLTSVVSGALSWVAYGFGTILLVTGIIGFCPLYRLFNFSTSKN
ncbi:MAG: DUF2892 domain-containing protein [Anaerolineales bacterium]|nr:DUF2892 domain-containing protein [Anaerolineales bacterium]